MADEENFFDQFDAPTAERRSAPPENYFDRFDTTQQQQQAQPEAEGMIGTVARAAKETGIGTAGAVAGAPVGAMLARRAAAPVGAMLAGRFLGGALGSFAGPVGAVGGMVAGGYLAERALNALGFDDSHQRAVNAKENPTAAIVGETAGMLPFFGAGAVPRVARIVGGVAFGGLEGVRQAYEGEFDPLRLAAQTATGAVLAKPTALTRGIESRVGAALGREAVSRPGFPAEGARETAAAREEVQPAGQPAGPKVSRGTAEEAPPPQEQKVGDVQNAAVRSERDYAAEPRVTEPGAAEPGTPEARLMTPGEIATARSGVNVGEDPGISAALGGEHVIPAEDRAMLQQQQRGAAPEGAPERPAAPPVPPGLEALVARNPRMAEFLANRYPELETMQRQARGPEQFQQQENLGAALRAIKAREEGAPAQPQPELSPAARAFQARMAAQRTAQQGGTLSPTGGGAAPPGAPPPVSPVRGAPPPPPAGAPAAARPPLDIAQTVDDALYRLGTRMNDRMYQYANRARAATRSHPELSGKGGEEVYHAIEEGRYDQLPTRLKEGYEKATAAINADSDRIAAELAQRGEIDPQPQSADYVHRINLSHQAPNLSDPVQGYIPGQGTPGSTKELSFMGATAKDGTRMVISDGEKNIPIFRDRKVVGAAAKPTPGEKLKSGDTFSYNGKDYTVDRGLTSLIEKHAVHADGTPVQYHKNAVASAMERHQELQTKLENSDLMRQIRNDPSFGSVRTLDAATARDRGWAESKVPELQGMFFHPDLRAAIDNNYKPGVMGDSGIVNWARAFNQFAVRSIFWNPVPHSMNALVHYLVARGGDWLPSPGNLQRFGKSIFEGFNSAIKQDQLLQEMNRAGAPLVMSNIDRSNMQKLLGGILGHEFNRIPGYWRGLAERMGVGPYNVASLHDAIYNGASRALWTFSDALMVARIRELEMKGMARPDAIQAAAIHMPNYRIPLRLFGSNELPKIMSDPTLMMFGRYHLGVINSLSHMATDLLGRNATTQQRIDAFGNVAALAVLGLVVKPMLDGVVQKLTGSKEAEIAPRGPLAPLTNAYKAFTGEKTTGQALSALNTFSPGVKQFIETLSNKDFAGRNIVGPGSPTITKAGEYADYTLGNVFSPYSTFSGTVLPKSSKGSFAHEFLTQLTDTRVPTEAQIKGKKYGEQMRKQEEKTRAKKPRGLIEYGTRQVPGGYARGGPVLQRVGQRRGERHAV